MEASPDLTPDHRPSGPLRRPALLAVAVAAVFFAAVAPTLRWQEFSGGSENLVVETVLEMRRGGPRLIPTLLDVPRVTKPPLAAWLTAAAVRDDTVARLTSRDQSVRDAAFRQLAWEVRWPSLLSACAMLLATYALARNLGLGPRVALSSAAVCGSTLLFLRFARGATTDVQLALWVTVANAFLALAFFRGRPWAGCLGAGAALGLAFMSKGPVALVQTVVPFALLLGWRRWASVHSPSPGTPGEGRGGGPPSIEYLKSEIQNPEDPHPSPPPEYRERVKTGKTGISAPALLGLVLMLLVALPWFAWVMRRYPNTLSGWWIEVTRVGATQLPADPWYTYLVLLPWLVPWLPWFVAGAWVAVTQAGHEASATPTPADRAWRDGTVAALFLVVAPIVLMSFFKDKNERYLLPMLAPAAVLAARAAAGWWQTPADDPARAPVGKVIEAVHWVTLALLTLALPAAAVLGPKTPAGEPWLSPAAAVMTAAFAAPVVALGYALRRRQSGGRAVAAAVGATAMLMLVLQVPAMHAYGRSDGSDLKPLADAVWAEYPDAVVWQFEPGGRTRVRIDLPIYLGRVTRPVAPADLPAAPGERPQVVVFLERYARQIPPLPAPWKEFAVDAGRARGWRAFVLPAAKSSS